MFKIFDGRNHFFQWDKERKLIVEDNSINQVHFCNRTGECSLIREVYELDGLRVVDVPEVILTEAWRIHVYGYDINHTKYEEVFEVKQRTRPDDYVYGEEELRSWDELIQKVEQIEREGFTDEQVEKAIESYLEENPIDVEGYVSDEELDAAIANLATQEYVDEQISAIPQVDLKGYATEKYVDDAINAIDIPSGGGSPGGKEWEFLCDITTEEDVKMITVDTPSNCKELYIVAYGYYTSDGASSG